MPRKQKALSDNNDIKPNKKNLMNTMIKNVDKKNENIILQLPLSKNKINNIINNEKEKIDTFNEPYPYEPNCCFLNDDLNNNSVLDDTNSYCNDANVKNNKICFWCCHQIDVTLFGMPTYYNPISKSYTLFGTFCSLQCANAYNFSVNSGNDKVWEINSLIQMLGKKYNIKYFIRPAPTKYLLKMFNGPMDIEEFRKKHHNNDTTHVLNLPPMISISPGYEILNTSYLHKKK
jgi:hypothetical protein